MEVIAFFNFFFFFLWGGGGGAKYMISGYIKLFVSRLYLFETCMESFKKLLVFAGYISWKMHGILFGCRIQSLVHSIYITGFSSPPPPSKSQHSIPPPPPPIHTQTHTLPPCSRSTHNIYQKIIKHASDH